MSDLKNKPERQPSWALGESLRRLAKASDREITKLRQTKDAAPREVAVMTAEPTVQAEQGG